MILAAIFLILICGLGYADVTVKKPHSKRKHAIHELTEAKTILTKMTPDAEGHSVKAAQQIDMAIQELSQMKEDIPAA